jgi:hypothetical protein
MKPRTPRPPGKPATPRPPARPRQPQPPRRQIHLAPDPAEPYGIIGDPSYVIVLWQTPELRQRDPSIPMSLHEALQAGRPYDPHFPIPGLPASPSPEPDREAEP